MLEQTSRTWQTTVSEFNLFYIYSINGSLPAQEVLGVISPHMLCPGPPAAHGPWASLAQRLSHEQSWSCRCWEEKVSMGVTFLQALKTLLSAHYPPQHRVPPSRSSQPYLQTPNTFVPSWAYGRNMPLSTDPFLGIFLQKTCSNTGATGSELSLLCTGTGYPRPISPLLFLP